MKNKAIDLHNILFEQLERLNDLDKDEIKSDELTNEIRRSEAINKVAVQLINNGKLVLDAIRVSIDAPVGTVMPEMLITTALPAPNTIKQGKK